MTGTAKRRWTRELESVVDGIAFAASGPVLLHGYDPPAGGMWIDDVIPGKLGAINRNTGETIWSSPCEVGYGRGFGAGLGAEDDVIVLGPSVQGHRIVRMSVKNGELIGAADIEPFDAALVFGDLCYCVTPGRIFSLVSAALSEAWDYGREGERYHHLVRRGDRLFVVFTSSATGRQGILRLDAETGERLGMVLKPTLPVIHGLAGNEDGLVVLTRDLATALPREVVPQFMLDLARHAHDGSIDTMSLLALPLGSAPGDAPLWYEILSTQPADDIPEVGVTADSGKLYLVRGALLEARDTLTGRPLGNWAVPGLDESVAWQVADGAGLLAEETRISVFELPA